MWTQGCLSRLAELEAQLESKGGSSTSGVKSGKSAAEKVKDGLIYISRERIEYEALATYCWPNLLL